MPTLEYIAEIAYLKKENEELKQHCEKLAEALEDISSVRESQVDENPNYWVGKIVSTAWSSLADYRKAFPKEEL